MLDEVGPEPRQWLGDFASVHIELLAKLRRCCFPYTWWDICLHFTHVIAVPAMHHCHFFFFFVLYTSHCLGASLLHQFRLYRLWITGADSCCGVFFSFFLVTFSLRSCISCRVGEKTTRRMNWDRRAHSRVRGRVQSLKGSEEKKQKKSPAVSPCWMVLRFQCLCAAWFEWMNRL